jgi:hypothetical protein
MWDKEAKIERYFSQTVVEDRLAIYMLALIIINLDIVFMHSQKIIQNRSKTSLQLENV